jgi:creatinine amidohydrolase
MLRFALFVIFTVVCFDARAHTPEGSIEPPSSHMKYAGSISMPEDIYKGILEYTARSRKVHEVIGTHAGLSDTTTLMAVAPQHVRAEFMLAKQDL